MNNKKMNNKAISYKTIRSNRRTISLQINKNLEVIVRVPLKMSNKAIEEFVKKHADWLISHMKIMEQKLADNVPSGEPLSDEELKNLAAKAKKDIPPLVKEWADKIGVSYNRITIKCQKSLWGSCSAKGNLNFNCLLMLVPKEVLNYVIVHELCHRRYMDHSKEFYSEIGKYLSDYKTAKDWLKNKGNGIIMRVHATP